MNQVGTERCGLGWRAGLAVLAVALAANLAVAFKGGLARPVQSDAHYFLQIARSLTTGQGYRCAESFWPGAPTMQRLPGWPAVEAVGVWALPWLDPAAVAHLLAALLNVGVALLLAGLTWRLLQRRAAAVLAGVGYAVHPTALHEALSALSEPLFLLLACAGAWLLLDARPWRRAAAALTLGCACLVRVNFVLWLPAMAGLGALVLLWQHRRPAWRTMGLWAVYGALFVLPALLWAARNHAVCGHFPVLSTLRGQTFYGGNNPVVAGTLDYWGYWVFPNQIPGEPTLAELAVTRSEYEVDAYYYGRGQAFIRGNLAGMPRLWLGKLVRAYVPLPWKPSLGSYAVNGFRALLYLAAFAGCVLVWKSLSLTFRLTLGAMALASVVTVVGFWGCARFAFAVEPFLLPLAAGGVLSAFRCAAAGAGRCAGRSGAGPAPDRKQTWIS